MPHDKGQVQPLVHFQLVYRTKNNRRKKHILYSYTSQQQPTTLPFPNTNRSHQARPCRTHLIIRFFPTYGSPMRTNTIPHVHILYWYSKNSCSTTLNNNLKLCGIDWWSVVLWSSWVKIELACNQQRWKFSPSLLGVMPLLLLFTLGLRENKYFMWSPNKGTSRHFDQSPLA